MVSADSVSGEGRLPCLQKAASFGVFTWQKEKARTLISSSSYKVTNPMQVAPSS